MGKYKTYSKEFKVEAVRLLEQSGKPGAEIARELGIKRNQLYKSNSRSGNNVGQRGFFANINNNSSLARFSIEFF